MEAGAHQQQQQGEQGLGEEAVGPNPAQEQSSAFLRWQNGEENAADLVQESSFLRWEGHRLQGANIALSLRFDDTVKKLETRGDREARKVLLGLATEAKDLVGVLAERLARISMVNRTVLEILQKSEDGKAALMMRKAAELLVKGLANAEEEVHSLKAAVREVEGQRDHYKALLAKTNSELSTSQVYAQMSQAIGQADGGGGGGADDVGIKRSAKHAGEGGSSVGGGSGSGKGKAPARQAQQTTSVAVGDGDGGGDGGGDATPDSRSTGGSGSGSGSSSHEGSKAAAVAGSGDQHSGEAPRGGVGRAKKGKGRAVPAGPSPPRPPPPAGRGARITAPGRMAATGSGAATTTTTASKKRRREAASGERRGGNDEGGGQDDNDNGTRDRRGGGDGASPVAGEEAGGGAGEGRRRRKRGGAASGAGRGEAAGLLSLGGDDGSRQVGVEVPVSDVTTGTPRSGDGDVVGDGEDDGDGGRGSEVDGGGEDEAGGGGGSEEYDSDDALSMFF